MNNKNYYKISNFLKSYEQCFEFSPKPYGRLYYTFYRAIDNAIENKKVCVIVTKNKKQFKNVILEFTKNHRGFRMKEYKKYYDIIKNDTLLVKIIEDINILRR